MILTQTASFESAPSGVYPARLFRIVDQGTQPSDYQGQVKHSRKLLFSFELLGDERMTDGKPFAISRRFTASLAEKSALLAFVNQWRGKALTEAELKDGFDLKRLLGQFCLLNLTETERNGNTYTNIASISPLPKGMPKPEAVNDAKMFDLNEPDWAVFEQLSERMQEQIAASPEYQAIKTVIPKAAAVAADTPFDDEISF